MPKIKTNRAAAKRFKRTKSGEFKRTKAFNRHLKTAKNAKRKRNYRKPSLLSESEKKRIKRLLPYSA
ncbi:MAG TPA: 50S ribosomal protein L35 [Candidatus Hydrogenedentes bacterium]|nr:50S ribosomal protein L35 [Candidatus Hydrogenedentota bacterium]